MSKQSARLRMELGPGGLSVVDIERLYRNLHDIHSCLILGIGYLALRVSVQAHACRGFSDVGNLDMETIPGG